MTPCIHQLFEASALRDPGAVALVAEGEELSYAELAARASRIARRLVADARGAEPAPASVSDRGSERSAGRVPERVVGICVPRSPALAAAVLGALESGGAYLPLDPDYPAERLRTMLADAGARQLVVTAATRERLAAEDLGRISVLELGPGGECDEPPGGVELPAPDPGGLAYVLYTSGSTGRPKGVEVTHANLANHARAVGRLFALEPADRVLQFAAFGFDVFGEETFPTWAAGAAVVLRGEAIAADFALFHDFLERERITVANLPAGYWHEWTAELERTGRPLPPSLRLVVTGSERVRPAAWRRWRALVGDRVRWLNGYGPTETTISATFHEPRPGDDVAEDADCMPIGRAIAGATARVLDGELRPVPDGEVGELCVGGAGVARGYRGRPDLTAERFVADPDVEGGRLYRTGDRARVLPSGDLEFLGRADHQVKLRGFRIELGEVESRCLGIDGVRECVALLREDGPGEPYLACWVAPESGAELDAGELARELRSRLPAYMVPSAFRILDALPRLPSGKVDVAGLPAVERASGAPWLAPRTPREEMLCAFYAELLGRERVGIRDSFFELGGHSLLATRLIARVREATGSGLSLPAIFEHPTPEGLAALLESPEAAEPAIELPPIERAARNGAVPVSFQQEPVWVLLRMDPETLAYNTQLSVRFLGPLEPEPMRRALTEIVRRHEVFRTTFPAPDGSPVQTVHEPFEVELPLRDLRALPPDEREREEARAIEEVCTTRFDVERLPLVRWELLRVGDEEWVLVQSEHHFVHDGWSIAILLEEIKELYAAFAAGRSSPLPELPIQYADYARWQREAIAGETRERLVAFWRETLAKCPPLLELPWDRPRPKVQTFRGETRTFDLAPELYDRARARARELGCTPFQLFFAVFEAVLWRWSGRADLVIATTVANRRQREIEGMIGMVVNTILLRADLGGDPSFRELARRVARAALAAYVHQDLPFEVLVHELEPPRDFSHNPLFQVMFSFHDAPVPDMDLPGVRGSVEYRHNGSAKFDMNVVVLARREQRVGRSRQDDLEAVTVEWEYNTDLFDRETVDRMGEHFRNALACVLADPDRRLSAIEFLGAGERRRVLEEWNGSDADVPRASWIALFDERAREDPERVAARFGGSAWTYAELAARAGELAAELRARGAGRRSLVGVALERSLEMLAALVAVHRVGAAWVPLDPSHPAERRAFVLDDAGASLLVTGEGIEDLARPDGAAPLEPGAAPALGDLAYVIYTSGSTGRPKGVAIEHRALANLLLAMRAETGIGAGDVLAAVTTVAFDIAGLELLLPLIAGATVSIASTGEAADGRALAEWLDAEGATLLQATPATWRMLLESGWEGRSALDAISGGEALPVELARRVRERVRRLWSVYGPTETTIWSSIQPVDETVLAGGGAVPLGRPLANTELVVLDERGGLLPIGVPGELAIGGLGLARGYHGRDDLTRERFVPNPWHVPGRPRSSARLYRTGDLVRRRRDGRLEFLGRLDHQVKVRGFRIELGEIEAVLAAHPSVREAVALAREETPGDARLVAYLVAGDGSAPGRSELARHLGERLPEYMIPSEWVLLESLPLTANGKVDRSALPDPASFESDADEHVPPEGELEERLAALFAAVLGRERVGRGDNFFDLGGHSLLAMRLIARVGSELGVALRPRDLMFQSLSQLATVCAERGASAPASADLAPVGASPGAREPEDGSGLGRRLLRRIRGMVSPRPDGPDRSR